MSLDTETGAQARQPANAEPTVAIYVGDHVTAIGRDQTTGHPCAGSATLPFPIDPAPSLPTSKKD